ncbi:MAG: hypothetical protein K0S53_500 [Bacteroidetes bacterium]|jgi:hypothetical protein|nr:hypothetical protein [Bacteroidota bacterium]MDF2453589.1 hypothetical protein [Bacteroidota bacterium]
MTEMTWKLQLKSTIKCPVCKYAKVVPMLLYTRRVRYDCAECHAMLKTSVNECCVFCVYGSVPCPTTQQDNHDQKETNQHFQESETA